MAGRPMARATMTAEISFRHSLGRSSRRAMACGTGVRFIVDLEAGKETCQLGKALLVAQMLGLNVGIAGQR